MLPDDIINQILSNVQDLQFIEHRERFNGTLQTLQSCYRYSIISQNTHYSNRCCLGYRIGYTVWRYKYISGYQASNWNKQRSVYCPKHGNYFNKHK